MKKKIFPKWKKKTTERSSQQEHSESNSEEWKRLIENGVREIEKVDIATIEQWLEYPKKESFINWRDNSIENGRTMLLCAIYYGRLDIVIVLLEHGADTNIANKDGRTALMYASYEGYTEVVELLLKKGADITVANTKGDTALIIASEWGRTNTVKLLLDKGADLTIANNDGETALSLASEEGHTAIVKLLLAKVAGDPDMCSSNRRTLLHWACLQNKWQHACQVLELGADRDKLDRNGHTALFYAAEKGHADIVELLMKDNDADANKTDERRYKERTTTTGQQYSFYSVKDGRTPLFIAAQNGHQNVVAMLLEHGADPYLCNSKSQIPRDVSVVHGSIQQLFRIQDFFDQRALRFGYEWTYLTCKDSHRDCQQWKGQASRLEDIIHDIVKYPHFAKKFLDLYQGNREIVNWLDKDGRTVRQVACKECREAILFLGQYDLEDQPVYESETCKIYNALDFGGLDEPRRVVMKFIENEEHFVNEIFSRRKDDFSSRFSSEFVTRDLAAYRADKHEGYAKACKAWKTNGSANDMLPKYCLVLERGERSLLESMNAENLSAKHKDLQRREILLTLCKIFSYIHDMGYVHGDIKPHNLVRHTDPTVTWKAIDFDACTKFGDPVGLKLTTGSAPPEMLKILQGEDSDDSVSMDESKVVLRQPGGGLDKTELVLADPSFDVWSYGILMYQLVTGRSFFHCNLQGNMDDAGLEELAELTEHRINKKLDGVEDVNARVLLSRILRLDPKERPTMSEIGLDYYFHPSKAPQGRKAKFFVKKRFGLPSAALEPSLIGRRVSDDSAAEEVEKVNRFLSSKSEFSYFKLRDEDKDWSDKLLNSEVETFRFDQLDGVGEKPRFIDGDTIYENDYLRSLLSNKGPDYFMGFLVEYFGLYKIMDDAHEVCQGIKTNLVSDVKSLMGIFVKLFVRGKGLNDVVRGTLFCNSVDQFKYVGRQLKEKYGHNVYIKPPKKEAGAWPIPKLLIYESQLVILVDKDKDFLEFLQSLNDQHIDTEGFLQNQSAPEGRFEILVDPAVIGDNGDGSENGEPTSGQATSEQYITKATGFITGGEICCGTRRFRFMSPSGRFQRFSESSFVVNKSLTLLSSHSYWSVEACDLEGRTVEFVVSCKGRGLAIAGIGTEKCLHGSSSGVRCSVHVGRSKFVVRKNGVQEVYREKKFPNQARAKIRFKMRDGVLSVSFVASEREGTAETDSVQVSVPSNQRYYYLYMRAPPGVHDVKFHEVSIN